MTESVAQLFQPLPRTWSRSGDLALWTAMREHFESVHMPDSLKALQPMVARAFLDLTGHDIAAQQDVLFDAFCAGDTVDPAWWRTEAIEILQGRMRMILTRRYVEEPPIRRLRRDVLAGRPDGAVDYLAAIIDQLVEHRRLPETEVDFFAERLAAMLKDRKTARRFLGLKAREMAENKTYEIARTIHHHNLAGMRIHPGGRARSAEPDESAGALSRGLRPAQSQRGHSLASDPARQAQSIQDRPFGSPARWRNSLSDGTVAG